MNVLQTRPAPASMGQEWEAFLSALSRLQEIRALVGLIDGAVSQGEEISAADWKVIETSVQWDNVPPVIMRYVALQTYNNKFSQGIFHQALSRQVIWLEDFRQMAKNWANVDFDMTWLTMQAAREAADYCCCPDEGESLAIEIANGGAYSWMAMQRNTTE